jgi:hypothetical protein
MTPQRGHPFPLDSRSSLRVSTPQGKSNPSFAQGIDKVLTSEAEKQVMGNFFTTNTYAARAVVESRCCSR